MPKPTNKIQLQELINKNYTKLVEFIDTLSEKEQLEEFQTETMNRNIRDVLGHIHSWQLMMMMWYDNGMKGKKTNIPAIGFTWKEVPALNRKIWEQNLEIGLEEIKIKLENSHKELQNLIEKHSDEELFEKKKYQWTGTTSLGAYIISATSSHYD